MAYLPSRHQSQAGQMIITQTNSQQAMKPQIVPYMDGSLPQ